MTICEFVCAGREFTMVIMYLKRYQMWVLGNKDLGFIYVYNTQTIKPFSVIKIMLIRAFSVKKVFFYDANVKLILCVCV